jgi:flavin-dependent dehydrogenase
MKAMTLPVRSDVLVVGGGPAGSTAATLLAKKGYSVVLIDKARHPRETVGESILPPAWRYFDLLGVTEEVERERFIKKAGGIVAWGDEISQLAFRDFGYKKPGLHMERAAIDELLLRNAQKCGVQVFEGVKAESFLLDQPDGTEVWVVEGDSKERQRVSCRFMIDATGQAVFLARQIGKKRLDSKFRFVSLWGYFQDSRYLGPGGVVHPFADVQEHPPVTFVEGLGGWGWAWHIPMRNETSVGLVLPVDEYKAESASFATLEDYFLHKIGSTRYQSKLVDGCPLTDGRVRMIRDFSYAPDNIAGPGYFVIGDASGFVDPIFSIGFVMALFAGNLAAWSIDRIMRRPDREADFRQLFDAQMRGRYQLSRGLALPGLEGEGAASEAAKVNYGFFSKAERDLMWSAAATTTRSVNLVHIAGADPGESVRLHQLDALSLS